MNNTTTNTVVEKQEEETLNVSNILDILDLYKIQYKLVGGIAMVNCLYHKGDNTPSMAVYSETNSFYCFGCHTHGTIETLLMKLENCSYKKASLMLYGKDAQWKKLREVESKKPTHDQNFLYNIISKNIKKALRSSIESDDKINDLIAVLLKSIKTDFNPAMLCKVLKKIQEVSK